MTTEITARDKLLLYVVGMLAFIFFFVQFMLTPALEASDEAAASLAEAQQAQIAMQETIALAGTNAAAKTESWAALQQANANYYGLLSSSDLDTLVSNLELGHDLGPVSLDISAIDTQSLMKYEALRYSVHLLNNLSGRICDKRRTVKCQCRALVSVFCTRHDRFSL